MRPALPSRLFGVVALLGAGATAWWWTTPAPEQARAVSPAPNGGPACANVAEGPAPTPTASQAEASAALPPSSVPTPAAVAAADPAVRASLTTRFARPLREIVETAKTHRVPLHIPLPLRQGETFDFHVQRIESPGSDDGVLVGEIAGHPGSLVVLSYVGLAQAGTIQLPAEGTAFRVRGTDDGAVRIDEIDLRKAPECLACMQAAHAHDHDASN